MESIRDLPNAHKILRYGVLTLSSDMFQKLFPVNSKKYDQAGDYNITVVDTQWDSSNLLRFGSIIVSSPRLHGNHTVPALSYVIIWEYQPQTVIEWDGTKFVTTAN